MALLIVAASFLPYIHDIADLKKYAGFSGFKTLRTGVYIVSMFVVALSGWVVAFINSKNKSYRFTMLAPIFMLAFQLAIYLFDARKTTTNEFSTKVVLSVTLIIVLIVVYFLRNKKEN